MSLFLKFALSFSHVAKKANGLRLFPLRIRVSSPSGKDWGGRVSRDLLQNSKSRSCSVYLSLGLPLFTTGMGSEDGAHDGKRKKNKNHLGSLVSNNRAIASDPKEKGISWKNLK